MSNITQPATLHANGNLPATYEAAQKALSECSRVDEVKDWADKAAALASYAKQAKDHSLLTLAQRIQARAVRRCGELLEQVPKANGANQNIRDGAVPKVTRESAATDAGLSERQRKTALRVANVPSEDFERQIESANPPTVTELAQRGTESRPAAPELAQVVPADSRRVAEATTLLRELAAFCGTQNPLRIAASPAVDADLLRGYVATVDRWLDRLVTHLPAETG
ncbi:MAG: hypothetical protein JSR67_12920 [Proteobacteria bacterium]|nr:hypothetical protein [Pseudomonadota bacterium]